MKGTPGLRPMSAPHNRAQQMEIQPRSFRFPRLLLLPRRSRKFRREILPREFPFRRTASNPAFQAARRAVHRGQLAGRAEGQAVTEEPATATEKREWRQASAVEIRRQTMVFPASADHQKSLDPFSAR